MFGCLFSALRNSLRRITKCRLWGFKGPCHSQLALCPHTVVLSQAGKPHPLLQCPASLPAALLLPWWSWTQKSSADRSLYKFPWALSYHISRKVNKHRKPNQKKIVSKQSEQKRHYKLQSLQHMCYLRRGLNIILYLRHYCKIIRRNLAEAKGMKMFLHLQSQTTLLYV